MCMQMCMGMCEGVKYRCACVCDGMVNNIRVCVCVSE